MTEILKDTALDTYADLQKQVKETLLLGQQRMEQEKVKA